MRTLFFLCLLILMAGCKKDKCYTCTLYQTSGLGVERDVGTEYRCGMTEDDKNFYQESNSHEINAPKQGIYYKQRMECK